MTIIERSRVLQTYQRAIENGAHTQEQAVATAAEELCLPEEAVIDVLWTDEGAAAL